MASEHNALLIIDERLGRLAARKLGLAITGVVGILIQAKHAGFQIEVISVLEEIRRREYWLSDNVLAVAAKLAGEMQF